MSQAEENRPAPPLPRGLLGRWLSPRAAPAADADSTEIDLGYESALPWLNSAAGEEEAGETAPG
jgi:hypothetical protein